jgi:hypothetical protein
MPAANDLGPCRADRDGVIACPECGQRVRRGARLLRSARRWRTGRLGFAIFTLGFAAAVFVAIQQRVWSQYLPTTCLIGIEWVGGSASPAEVKRELNTRAIRGEAADWQRRATLALLMRDLRDDDVAHNADVAMQWLRQYGPHATGFSEKALHSDDWQQRDCAARLLRDTPGYPATPALVRATIDAATRLGSRINASWGMRQFLATHIDVTEDALREAMLTGDDAQQSLCAFAAMQAQRASLMEQAVPIIVRHLRDNDQMWDASLALGALRGLGLKVVPLLQPSLESNDWQERQLAAHVLRGIDVCPITPTLLRATCEGLQDDRLLYDHVRRRYSWVRNATEGVTFLVEHARDAEATLREGMRSHDMAQRFYCAAIAGFAEHAALMHTAAPILIETSARQ